mmetsp:Transcript_28366/g.90759  ORF Transcript_28366/g.90759 Transcript_28366/m.90759 type:complete len:283 (-) Transcript_28366:146-994(-)
MSSLLGSVGARRLRSMFIFRLSTFVTSTTALLPTGMPARAARSSCTAAIMSPRSYWYAARSASNLASRNSLSGVGRLRRCSSIARFASGRSASGVAPMSRSSPRATPRTTVPLRVRKAAASSPSSSTASASLRQARRFREARRSSRLTDLLALSTSAGSFAAMSTGAASPSTPGFDSATRLSTARFCASCSLWICTQTRLPLRSTTSGGVGSASATSAPAPALVCSSSLPSSLITVHEKAMSTSSLTSLAWKGSTTRAFGSNMDAASAGFPAASQRSSARTL